MHTDSDSDDLPSLATFLSQVSTPSASQSGPPKKRKRRRLRSSRKSVARASSVIELSDSSDHHSSRPRKKSRIRKISEIIDLCSDSEKAPSTKPPRKKSTPHLQTTVVCLLTSEDEHDEHTGVGGLDHSPILQTSPRGNTVPNLPPSPEQTNVATASTPPESHGGIDGPSLRDPAFSLQQVYNEALRTAKTIDPAPPKTRAHPFLYHLEIQDPYQKTHMVKYDLSSPLPPLLTPAFFKRTQKVTPGGTKPSPPLCPVKLRRTSQETIATEKLAAPPIVQADHWDSKEPEMASSQSTPDVPVQNSPLRRSKSLPSVDVILPTTNQALDEVLQKHNPGSIKAGDMDVTISSSGALSPAISQSAVLQLPNTNQTLPSDYMIDVETSPTDALDILEILEMLLPKDGDDDGDIEDVMNLSALELAYPD